jgi:hypothetical protein
VASTAEATAEGVAMAAVAATEAAVDTAAAGTTAAPTMMEDTAAAVAKGAVITRGTLGTAAEPADPEDPLNGDPMVAPDPDPVPDPGSWQGAAGPGGAVTRHIKGPLGDRMNSRTKCSVEKYHTATS